MFSASGRSRYRSIRWRVLLSYVRVAAAALAVFVGLAWGALLVLEPDVLAALERQSWRLGEVLLWTALAAAVLVGGASGILEARELQERMRTLTEAARLWANGKLGHRIVEGGVEDEFVELGFALNRMAQRLEEQVAALQRLVEKNETLQGQAASAAALEERSRLARELHDSVSQQLFALGMTAGAASKLMNVQAERAVPLVAQVEEMAAKAQAEMRALLLHLRPIELEGRSLGEALERFLQDVCPRYGLRYDLAVEAEGLGEGIESQLFRICQEAVSNVIRHASATRLEVQLVRDGQKVVFSVRDDGRGFEAAAVRDGSYGMQTLRERTEEIGGRLEVRSARGSGTEVRVAVKMVTGR